MLSQFIVVLNKEMRYHQSRFFFLVLAINAKCVRVVGGNNYISNDIYKWKTTEILSRILAIFLHSREILNIRDKNETSSFLNDFYIYFS